GVSFGSNLGGSQPRIVTVPPRFGACASARADGSAAPTRPTLPSASTSRRVHAMRLLLGTLELGRAPPQGRAETLFLADLVECLADLGRRRVERREHVEPGADRVAEAGGVGAATQRALGRDERLRADQRQP